MCEHTAGKFEHKYIHTHLVYGNNFCNHFQ